jgi:hypothetical protein
MGLAGSAATIVGDWDEWPMKRPLTWSQSGRERFLDAWLRGRADRVIVASRYLQRAFADFAIDAAYIPYAVYMPTYTDGHSPYGDEPTIVYMGNFHPFYDHDLLLEAADVLKKRGRTPRIDLLGQGPDLPRWQTFARDRGLTNVRFLGFVRGENLWRRLRHAHALVFPIRETLSNLSRCPSKTFSYAQAQRPIITNRVGEVAEILGDQATYIDATPHAFADAIENVLCEPQREVDYGVERHTWAARTDKLMEVLANQQPRTACANDRRSHRHARAATDSALGATQSSRSRFLTLRGCGWTPGCRTLIGLLSLAATVCLVAQVYELCSMRKFTATVLLPATVALAMLTIRNALFGDRRLAQAVLTGAAGGLLAAVALDLFRLPFVIASHDGIGPHWMQLPLYRMYPHYGAALLGQAFQPGQPESAFSLLAHLVGWGYHFLRWSLFGVTYVALAGSTARRPWWEPALLAVSMKALLLLTPWTSFIGLRVSPATVAALLGGHLVLGVCLWAYVTLHPIYQIAVNSRVGPRRFA